MLRIGRIARLVRRGNFISARTVLTIMALERAHPNVALPRIVHAVASTVSTSTRVLILGDVHGCFDELQLLLEKCNFCPSEDRLVFVGDLVNKGPKSLDVVRFVRNSRSLCVRGNHEDAALAAYYEWVRAGRISGTAKYPYIEHFEAADVEFLEQLPFTLSLPTHEDIIVVHAGFVPEVALKDQRPYDMYKVRFVQRKKAEDGNSNWIAREKNKIETEEGEPLERWAKVWKGPRHVYFGHAAALGLQQEKFATGLDTGCCYGRKLTACIIPSNTIMQVYAKEEYEVPNGDKKEELTSR